MLRFFRSRPGGSLVPRAIRVGGCSYKLYNAGLCHRLVLQCRVALGVGCTSKPGVLRPRLVGAAVLGATRVGGCKRKLCVEGAAALGAAHAIGSTGILEVFRPRPGGSLVPCAIRVGVYSDKLYSARPCRVGTSVPGVTLGAGCTYKPGVLRPRLVGTSVLGAAPAGGCKRKLGVARLRRLSGGRQWGGHEPSLRISRGREVEGTNERPLRISGRREGEGTIPPYGRPSSPWQYLGCSCCRPHGQAGGLAGGLPSSYLRWRLQS